MPKQGNSKIGHLRAASAAAVLRIAEFGILEVYKTLPASSLRQRVARLHQDAIEIRSALEQLEA